MAAVAMVAAEEYHDLCIVGGEKLGMDAMQSLGFGVSIVFGTAMDRLDKATKDAGVGPSIMQNWCHDQLQIITERIAASTGFKFYFDKRDKKRE